MGNLTNNLFNYATSELSQDAFIRYCLEFYNTNDIILKQLSVDLLKSFDKDIDIDKVEKIQIYPQYEKIDLLIALTDINKVIIIEDKINSSEHDNQIKSYREIIEALAQDDNRLSIDKNFEIKTIYFKTGFINDDDRYIERKYPEIKKFFRNDFIEILQKYINYNYIIRDYYDYLIDIDNSEKNIDYIQRNIYDNEGNKISYWDWNIATSSICQQKFMRDIFNNDEYKYDFDSGLFYLWSGSSFGRPFTEFDVFSCSPDDQNKLKYGLFWRIDTDTKGPYLALRLYGRYVNNEQQKEKIEIYNELREYTEKVFNEICFNDYKWEDVKKYKNGNGGDYESTIIHFNIADLLTKWYDLKIANDFKYIIKKLNNHILDYIKNI